MCGRRSLGAQGERSQKHSKLGVGWQTKLDLIKLVSHLIQTLGKGQATHTQTAQQIVLFLIDDAVSEKGVKSLS